MRPTTVQTYRWTRQEFEQLAAIGIFDRNPVGANYQAHTVYHIGDLVTLLSAPNTRIAVADLLPKVS